jgi:hypothetical protein
MGSRRRRTLLLVALLAEPVAMWLRGYPLGGRLVVRCRRGHLFTTLWIPGVSFKALRLGWLRVQRCPVGNHWTIVTPVKRSELTASQREAAAEHRDSLTP